jgi:hypothetical protein
MINTLSSLRGTTRILNLFSNWFNGEVPCHTIVQDWVMRYGLYQLLKQPEQRDDWVYVVDHTIDFGTKKCFLVLGITLEKLHQKKFSIKHQDMEVFAIRIEESATSESVRTTLEEVCAQTGVPIQIVSDSGANIKKGIKDFQKDHNMVIATYDVTHQAALLLKYHTANDGQLKDFYKKIAETKRSLVHTCIAFLAPPKPRDKCRWMNLERFLNWAEKIASYKDQAMSLTEQTKYDECLNWISDFTLQMAEWRTMLNMLNHLQKEIKQKGLCKQSKKNIRKKLSELEINTIRQQKLRNEILKYVDNATARIPQNRAYLGSSDIIESVFGKYKFFSAKTPMKEIGKTVLTIPVFTNEINPGEVKKALETVSTKDLHQWQKDNIGQTLFAQRKRVFNLVNTKTPVNLSQNKCPKVANF